MNISDEIQNLDLKINVSDENEKRLLKASEKINLAISPHNNFVNKNNVKKSISNKNNLIKFNKIHGIQST